MRIVESIAAPFVLMISLAGELVMGTGMKAVVTPKHVPSNSEELNIKVVDDYVIISGKGCALTFDLESQPDLLELAHAMGAFLVWPSNTSICIHLNTEKEALIGEQEITIKSDGIICTFEPRDNIGIARFDWTNDKDPFDYLHRTLSDNSAASIFPELRKETCPRIKAAFSRLVHLIQDAVASGEGRPAGTVSAHSP